MRIAIVIDSLEQGGAERQVLYAARELARRGCHVDLHYYYSLPSEYDHALAGGANLILSEKKGSYARFLFRLKRRLKEGTYDVVYAVKEQPAIYGGVAAWLAGVPVRFGGHRMTIPMKGMTLRGLKFVDRRLTGWIVNSEAIRESLKQSLRTDPHRCHIVHNGIDPALFVSRAEASVTRRALGLDADAPVITIVGRLRAEKNHRMFLRVAQHVLRRRPQTRFLAIGDGPERETLEGQCREMGIEREVLFLGARRDVPDLLAATDVTVLTSPREGLANSLVESMCMGVPVVTTAYPGVDEVVSSGVEGYVTPVDDAEAMAEGVENLLSNPDRRKKMGEAGMRRVQRQFTVEAMGGRLLKIFEDARRTV